MYPADAGAFYDHVVPPFEDVPDDDAPCHLRDQCSPTRNKFDFRRLGLRTSSMLISPLVAKGSVFQEPTGPTNTSQFDHTSVLATMKNMFNLSGFLTKRDMWAGSFDELLLDTPRTDTPLHLPDAPKPAAPWTPPPNDTSVDGAAHPIPQHCSLKEQECTGPEHISMKQRNAIHLFADLVPDLERPDVDELTEATADTWLHAAWGQWLAADDGIAVRRDQNPEL